MHIHGIYHVYVDVLQIHGMYVVYPWIYHVHPFYGYSMVSMDIPCISIQYIHGISLYIHGISFYVYTWYIRGISTDIPGYSTLKPDFSASPCCWSHSMRTRVWVIRTALFHAPPWQLCQGKRQTTKGSTRLPPTSPPMSLVAAAAVAAVVAAAALSLASVHFPSLVAGNDLNLGERLGRGSLQGRCDQCVEQLRC
jgi:hypothetical protein